MESTEVSSSKTAGEITELLRQSGSRKIATNMDPTGNIIGLSFDLIVGGFPVTFALPVRTEPVYKILLSRRSWPSDQDKARIRAQAERVAWRQMLRWIQAQLALIDVGMVQPQEVFLPYLIQAGSGQTLFEYFEENGMKQLTAGD